LLKQIEEAGSISKYHDVTKESGGDKPDFL